MEHVLIKNDHLEVSEDQLQKYNDNKTRKRWCMFISGSFVLVCVICLGVWYISDLAEGKNSNNSVILNRPQICDTCAMFPEFDDYCVGHTCTFNKNNDKTIVCPAGYGNIQMYKAKFGGHSRAAGLVLLQNECSDQMFGLENKCTFNVAELAGVDTMPVEETDILPEEEDAITMIEEEEEPEPLLTRHRDPDSVKVYYLCNKLEDTTEVNQMMLSTPLSSDMTDEEFPFLSVAFVKCNTREWKADYLEGGKACAKDGSFSLSCRADVADPRIIIVKAHPKDKGAPPADKAEKKQRKKNQKAIAAKANDLCGDQGNGQCEFEIEQLFEGQEIPQGKFKVEYLCSYGEVVEDNSSDAPLLLGNPYYFEDDTFPLLTSTLMSCNSNKPVGQYVENGKSCSSDEAVLQCDATRNPRVIVAKVKPERSGPKETDPSIRAGNKAAGKERTLNANNFCGNPDNIIDGACTLVLNDILAEGDSFEEGQLLDIKFFCSYDTPAIEV